MQFNMMMMLGLWSLTVLRSGRHIMRIL